MKSLVQIALAAAALLGLAACGGGSSSSGVSSSTTSLTYVNPTNTSGNYALMLDSSSTASSLVLKLVGPDGTPAVGVTFAFDVDTTKATWATSPVVTNGTLFTGTNKLVQGWVNGGRLQGIAANKGLANQLSDIGVSTGVLATVRLAPVSGAAAGTVTLTDSGLGTSMDQGGTPEAIHLLVGTLTLN